MARGSQHVVFLGASVYGDVQCCYDISCARCRSLTAMGVTVGAGERHCRNAMQSLRARGWFEEDSFGVLCSSALSELEMFG